MQGNAPTSSSRPIVTKLLPGLSWLRKDNREKYGKILHTHILNIFCIQILYTDTVQNNACFI